MQMTSKQISSINIINFWYIKTKGRHGELVHIVVACLFVISLFTSILHMNVKAAGIDKTMFSTIKCYIYKSYHIQNHTCQYQILI